MTLSEGKEKFISEWGGLCMNWGVCRTMGQIHGLLLIASNPMCCEGIMEQLKLSRGNVNMNIRALIDWGLVRKKLITGERKEYFEAEKDLWKVFRLIIEHRKKKELDPMLELLNNTLHVEGKCSKSDEFCRMMKELRLFANKADDTLNAIVKSENNWLTKSIMQIF